MVELVNALAAEFASFAPEIAANPKISLYRIYRDTRFSKDKSPYKTHAAAGFPHRHLEKGRGAGFYLHISPSEFLIGGGLYHPETEDLAAIRDHVAQHHPRLTAILGMRRFRRLFTGLQGEERIRVPRGFPADHPAADFLKRREFLASRQFPSDVVATPQFGAIVLETFQSLHPLIQFLNEPLVKRSQAKLRRSALLN